VDAVLGSEGGRSRGRTSGRGGNGGGDGAAPCRGPLARQLLVAMILRRQATRRNFSEPIKAAPAPKLTTHLRASIMLNLFSIANASTRRPPVLPPFSLPSLAINLAMAPLPLIILVCLILILPTLHVCLLLQH